MAFLHCPSLPLGASVDRNQSRETTTFMESTVVGDGAMKRRNIIYAGIRTHRDTEPQILFGVLTRRVKSSLMIRCIVNARKTHKIIFSLNKCMLFVTVVLMD
ncbi:hypothetical protein KP509_19G027500 [Ceratopteris richardii]|uniref:Uncharacterized protein n=1 Tax=Ceratopteris richardii TaxID=49495 RepID=A0A8T2SMI6_CERRI|nr:hypothetical protein KP509_19G027500 [Ceratopteris richardii]